MIKKLILSLVIFAFFLPSKIQAEEIVYYLKDAVSTELVGEYTSFNSANRAFSRNKEDYQNLVLYENDNVIKMEYGVVEFVTSSGCTYNVNYLEKHKDEGYINGCYGSDAAYLGSSNNAGRVYFKMSGIEGEASIHDVTLHPFEDLDVRLSMYRVNNGNLIHDIKTQLVSDYYSSSIELALAPNYLEEGKQYYSYDGHYFYEDFYLMIDDYIAKTSTNAVNYEEAFYNYYQYLPHRSLSNYTYSEIERYFTNVLHFDRKVTSYYDLNRDSANDIVNASQYVGELKAFFEYQNIYGANALMMLSLSMNESAYGKSLLSYTRNNLFGHAAFDSDVERNASRYQSVEASIYSHARYYISDRYSNHLKYTYHGSYFGDKSSGMNVMYASDPYWGEKAASNYRTLDQSLGNKDANQYSLGLIEEAEVLSIYEDAACTNLLYRIEDLYHFSFILLDEDEIAYKVQLDTTMDENHRYDFKECVGYVLKDEFTTILNPEKMMEHEFVTITFDSDGGQINQEEVLKMQVKKGDIPIVNNPTKVGYDFIGFEPTINVAQEDRTYKALYKEIDSIELVTPIETTIEYLRFYDLSDGKIQVHYKDGTSKYVLIDTDMISGLDTSILGEQVIQLSYAGLTIDIPIYISEELDSRRIETDELIANNLETYKANGSFKSEDLLKIKDNMKGLDYIIDFDTVRYLDQMLLDYYGDSVSFVLDDQYDLSISGMALSLDIDTKEPFPYFKNTYYLEVDALSNASRKDVLDVASAYGFEEELSFSISFKENLKRTHGQTPFIVQVALNEKASNKIYTVYRIDEDGSVNKCRTTQTTSFVQFLTEKEGDFMVLSMDSSNQYDFIDAYENLNQGNQDLDIHFYFYRYSLLVILAICDIIFITNKIRLKKEGQKEWNDYKKSLRKVASAQEEKPKNSF